jgi:hypothetical protein
MAVKRPVYKFKPTGYKASTASYFKPTITEKETLTKSIDTQVANLEKRFQNENIPLTGIKDVDQRNLIEKALNLAPDQNLLMDVFEVMDRPRQVVSNILSSLGASDKRNVLEAAWDGLAGKEKISTKEALQNLTGDKKLLEADTGNDIADNVINAVVDIGLDIFTDPTTYIGFGFVAKPIGWGTKKTVGLVGQGANKLAKIAGPEAAAKWANATIDMGNFVKRTKANFNSFYDLSNNFIAGFKKLLGAGNKKVSILEGRLRFLAERADKIAKATGKTTEDVLSTFTEIYQKASKINSDGTVELLDAFVNVDDIFEVLTGRVTNLQASLAGSKKAANVFRSRAFKKGSAEAISAKKKLEDLFDLFKIEIPEKDGFRSLKKLIKITEVVDDVNGSVIFKVSAQGEGAVGAIERYLQALRGRPTLEVAEQVAEETVGFIPRNYFAEAKNYWDANFATDEARTLLGGVSPLSVNARRVLENKEVVEEIINGMSDIKEIGEGAVKLATDEGYFDLPEAITEKNLPYLRRVRTEEVIENLKAKAPADIKTKVGKEVVSTTGAEMTARNKLFQGSVQEINNAQKLLFGKGPVFDDNILRVLQEQVRIAEATFQQGKVAELILGVRRTGSGNYELVDDARNFFLPVGTASEKPIGAARGIKKISNEDLIKFKRENPNFIVLEGGFARYTAGGKVIGGEFQELVKSLPPDFAKAFKELLERRIGGPANNRVAIHTSAYKLLKSSQNAYTKAPELIRAYDKAMDAWKSITLVTPGFHVKNVIGNMTNMYLAGMNPIEVATYTTSSIMEMLRRRKVLSKIEKFGQNALDAADNLILKTNGADYVATGLNASRRGVRDLGPYKQYLSKKFKNRPEVLKKIDNFLEFNFEMAELLDDVQRNGTYKWAKEKALKGGATLEAAELSAATVVRETLFDYSALTPFEKNYMKRFAPFYTFMKNNLVFQATNLMKNTGKYKRLIGSYKNWVENITEQDINNLPDYMIENMWLPIPMEVSANDEEAIAFLRTNLPVSDFFEFVENPLKKGASTLSVPIKLTAELVMNQDLLTGAPIKEFEGQKDQMKPGEGTLSFLRGERGDFSVVKDPVIKKIANDLGFRNIRQGLTVLLNSLDTIAGKRPSKEFITDLLEKGGVLSVRSKEDINLTGLYQQLEYLRNLKKLYEQTYGEKLPSLRR